MINSLRIHAEISFKTEEAALKVKTHWHDILEYARHPSGISICDCFLLQRIKILPFKGVGLEPTVIGSKLTLDFTIPCIFWRPNWEAISQLLGDLVPEVASLRGMPSRNLILNSELSPTELKLEMWSNVFKFGSNEALYKKNLQKILR